MWWPPTMLEPPALEHVPASVEANRSEASTTASGSAPIEAPCRWCDARSRPRHSNSACQDDRAHQKLHQQIDWLAETGAITPQLKELAHELRFFGNDGAHPDRDGLENVSKEDAAVALGFLEDFLRYAYVLPRRVAAVTAARKQTPPASN